MVQKTLKDALFGNDYPGRGIIVGRSDDGRKAIVAYWLMGRSENSRNRVFVQDGYGIRTQAFDEAKLTDPSLIIYAPVKVTGAYTVVTNGDQTDTVVEGMKNGLSFEQSLHSRTFEPDSPNFTPRISAILNVSNGSFSFSLSMLKSDNGDEDSVNRYTFDYENPRVGVGRYIHTYMQNGNPLPSFEGEPEIVELSGGINELTESIWKNLNEENRVSLFVRYIDIESGKNETRIVNKNQ